MDAAANIIVNSKTNMRPMLRLALPVVIEQLMIMMVTWTDHYLTAQHLETPHLAAINLMAYVLWVLPLYLCRHRRGCHRLGVSVLRSR